MTIELPDGRREPNEVLEARIWAGIHFRNPDVQAADLGRDVERYVHKHLFSAAH